MSANVFAVHDAPEHGEAGRRGVRRLSQATPFTACGGRRPKAAYVNPAC
jgi:hypothetical protein